MQFIPHVKEHAPIHKHARRHHYHVEHPDDHQSNSPSRTRLTSDGLDNDIVDRDVHHGHNVNSADNPPANIEDDMNEGMHSQDETDKHNNGKDTSSNTGDNFEPRFREVQTVKLAHETQR